MTPSTIGRKAGLRWSVLLIATIGALGTAACGSDSSQPAQRKAPGGAENSEQRQAYVACLEQNGVSMPEKSGSGGQRTKIDAENPPPGVDPAVWGRARQACASLAPAPTKRTTG